jgi:hypothetical protein
MNEASTMHLPTMERDDPQTLVIPHDLSQWVPAALLRQWIMTDVAGLDWTNPEIMELLRRNPNFEPKALLNTLTFGYATGTFGAEEIARLCSVNPEFRTVRPKLPPEAEEFKAFRKENRGLLKWSLAHVITRALRTRFVDGETIEHFPAGLRRYVVQNAEDRLELARHMDRNANLL